MRFGSRFLLISVYCLLLATPALAQEIDILWHGETSVPPFYKGLPMWGSRSIIKLVAIPQDVTRIDPSQAMYWWSNDRGAMGNYNAIGKSYLAFADSPYVSTRKIQIELMTEDFLPLAKNGVNIAPRSQQVLVYEDHPLYGLMLHREAGERYVASGNEITLRAIPLYFDAINREGSIVEYEWRAGGRTQAGSAVTYRVPEGAKGTSGIRLSASRGDNSLERAGKSFLLEFK